MSQICHITLISLAHVAGDHLEMFLAANLRIQDKCTGCIIVTGVRHANLYYIKATGLRTDSAYAVINATDAHAALGHIGADKIRQLASGIVNGFHLIGPVPDRFVYTKCIQGKHMCTSQPKAATTEITAVGDLIVTDVVGGGTKLLLGIYGIHYVVTFTDARSGFTVCYYLKHKSEVIDRLKKFLAWFKNRVGKSVITIRSDLGGEYTSGEFCEYCALQGIELQNTAPYSLAQNGKAEWLNRHLADHVIAMLTGCTLPISI